MKSFNHFGTVALVLYLGLGLVPLSIARAGQDVGNGGGGYVCRDESMKITRAVLLDLVEATEDYIFPVIDSQVPVDAQIDSVLVKLSFNSHLKDYLKKETIRIQNEAIFLRPVAGLLPIFDAHPEVYLKGCHFEQIANYTARGRLKIDREIYDAMSMTNRAALFVHEAVYKYLRDTLDAKDSDDAREIVANLFSAESGSAELRALLKRVTKDRLLFIPTDRPVRIRVERPKARCEVAARAGVEFRRDGQRIEKLQLFENNEDVMFFEVPGSALKNEIAVVTECMTRDDGIKSFDGEVTIVQESNGPELLRFKKEPVLADLMTGIKTITQWHILSN